MDPVCFQEVDQKDDTAERPCDGVCPGDGGKPIDQLYCYGDIGDTDHAPAGQHGKHGHGSLACAPHDRGDAVGKSQQEIEKANGAHVLGAKTDGVKGVAEYADKLGRKYI